MKKNIQLLHIFDPILLSGSVGSRIEKKYIMPLLTSPKIDLVSFSSDIPAEKKILQKIIKAFELSDQELGYVCGFGTASYFGKVFSSNFGITPTQYRNNWQNPTK